ncbi:MAG: hypothetical protein KDA93_23980 [Planctomycetaceae bacterium]|nr:hypothetical protein [Planctomycetaceae bacterium]
MTKATQTLDSRRIVALRQKHCLTQEELADKAGCTKRTVENAEAGNAVLVATANNFAAVFGVPTSSLFLDRPGDENGDERHSDRAGIAPSMPALLIGRQEDLKQLRLRILTALAASQVSHERALLTVRGWPGVGKTTIARAFAHDDETSRTFADGVLWTSLGQSPTIRSTLVSWCTSLSIEIADTMTDRQVSERLAGHLANRSMLVIIDDVWQVEDANPLLIGGRNCATLLTTRLSSVADALSSKDGDVYPLGILSETDALQVLRVLAPDVVKKFKRDCQELVKNLECLPLALQVAGRMLRIEFQRTGVVKPLLTELYEDARRIMSAPAPADMQALQSDTAPSVIALFNRSTDLLDSVTRERFAMLAPFAPKPAMFELDDIEAIWEVEDARPTVGELVDRGLLESLGGGRFQIHALLVLHARTLCTE